MGVQDDYCSGSTYATYLQEIDLEILTQDECRSSSGTYRQYDETLGKCIKKDYSLRGEWKITSDKLCARNKAGGICKGDAGGPLTVKQEDGRHVLVGIASSFFGCGLVSFPLKIFLQHSEEEKLGPVTSYPFYQA